MGDSLLQWLAGVAPRRRVVIASVVAVALLVAAMAGTYVARSADDEVVPAEPVAAESLAPSATASEADPEPETEPASPAEESVTESSSPSPEPSPSPTPKKPDPQVLAAQQVLAEHGYYLGAIDGFAGAATRSATMAFQKVHGLSADGVLGPITYAALDAPVTPTLHGGAAHRVEVDLTKQVAYYVEGGALRRIMPVSSGNGDKYRHPSGSLATALTPVGAFKVQRKITGIREAPLGILYDPLYFHGGWALHGSNHVPAYPASHGCIRLTRWDATWLSARVPVGTQVLIYGGTHTFKAGEELSKVGTTEPGGDDAELEAPSDEPTEEPSSDPAPSPSEPSASESESSPDPTTSPSPSEPSEPSDPSEPSEPSESPEPSTSESSDSPSQPEPSDSPSPSTSASASSDASESESTSG